MAGERVLLEEVRSRSESPVLQMSNLVYYLHLNIFKRQSFGSQYFDSPTTKRYNIMRRTDKIEEVDQILEGGIRL